MVVYGYVFVLLIFVILHLSVHTAASLQEIYNIGWDRSVYVCVYVFPVLVILHLWVHTTGSLEEIYSVGFREVVGRLLPNATVIF